MPTIDELLSTIADVDRQIAAFDEAHPLKSSSTLNGLKLQFERSLKAHPDYPAYQQRKAAIETAQINALYIELERQKTVNAQPAPAPAQTEIYRDPKTGAPNFTKKPAPKPETPAETPQPKQTDTAKLFLENKLGVTIK